MKERKFYGLAVTGGGRCDYGHVGFAKNAKLIKQLVLKLNDLSPYQKQKLQDWDINEDLELDDIVYRYFKIACKEGDSIHFSFIWEEGNGSDCFEYTVNMTLEQYIQKAKSIIYGEQRLKPRKLSSFDDVTKIERFLDLMSVEEHEDDDAYISAEKLNQPLFKDCNYESDWL